MKNLIFIPYQDVYDFDNTGIMTREYSMLLLLLNSGIENLYNIGKPRTILDVTKYNNNNSFPKCSYEYQLKQKITESKQLRHFSFINSDIILKKRAWWPKGYKNLIKEIDNENLDFENTLVYSNTPFSYELIEFCHRKGATIIFDMMDNFYIHPSLSLKERRSALEGYSKIAKVADFFSCNSEAIKKFCLTTFDKDPILIKNGVFPPQATNSLELPQYKALVREQKKFKRTVGYIGKLGMRIDEKLIAEISEKCPETLFVFIGPHLRGQKNTELIDLMKRTKNILYLGSVSSVYIYNFLQLFDVLSIPHAVGERENGGDPLKLYQYLNTEKPIITTPILGVDEFKNLIKITNSPTEWINFINDEEFRFIHYKTPKVIYWKSRANDLINFLNS